VIKIYFSATLLLASMVLAPHAAMSTTLFDFDEVPGPVRRVPRGQQVELYMESLYGSNITVSQKTTPVHGAAILGAADAQNFYLQLGRGKGPAAIVIQFDENPIDSFSIDFKLFKRAKPLSIYADGQLISVEALSKAQRKTGLSGQETFVFDKPVHTLEFRGKKKSFAIDNLVVDLPSGGETTGGVILQGTNPPGTNPPGSNTGETNTQESDTNPPPDEIDETDNPDPFDLPSDPDNGPNNPPSGFFLTGDTLPPGDAQAAAVPEPASLLLLLFGCAATRWRSFYIKRRRPD